MLKVIKRNKSIVEFDGKKIENAIKKAFDATKTPIPEEYAFGKMMVNILARVQRRVVNEAIGIEDIQDAVEAVLSESGYFPVAKAYILYRQQHQNIRDAASSYINFSDLMNGYLDRLDWRVKENSTVSYTVGGLILSNSGSVTANYWLNDIYDKEIRDAHKNCLIHLHDLSMLTGYCAGWNLKDLIQRGLTGVAGRISSAPAKHLGVLCNQMVNFIGIMQNEWAGAQAFSSFDTYLAPFVKVDNLSYREVKQAVQSFVFGVNTPSRWGTQSPFSNITLDWKIPEDLRNIPAIVGGKEMDFTYGDCQKEADMVNKAFLEIMNEGDANGRGFQYPIPTYSITKDFDWSETENNKLLFEMTAKYGTPYFANYINSDMNPADVRSMCCRLRLDLRDLRRRNGGFFGAGENTGSIGVVTLNLPHIAYISKDEDEFWKNLDHYMDVAARSLRIKRETVTKLLEGGLYPYTKAYLGSFHNHFSTIGLVGGNEMCLNAKWLSKDLTHPASWDFVEKMLNHMRDRLSDYQEKYAPNLYNLEATPAESTAYRFAKHDKQRFPDIITANEHGTPYYTNSTNLPVGSTDDVFDALDIQDHFQPLYTSGTVFHTFLGEKLPSYQSAMKLVKTMCDNYKLPYISISPTYSICSKHGYITGEHFTCPECGKETEVYSRITGYYRSVKNWNDGKTQEFADRKTYSIGASAGRHPESYGAENAECACHKKETVSTDKGLSGANLLFTTPTCPNCKWVKAQLEQASIPFETVDAAKEPDTVQTYHVMQAPTLIAGGITYTGAGKIREFILSSTNNC